MCVSGGSTSKPSAIEVTAEMEKEVMTLDDEETFGNFYKTISPATLQDSAVILTEDDLSQIQSDTPTSVNSSVSTTTDDLKLFSESLRLILWLFTIMKRPNETSIKHDNDYNIHWICSGSLPPSQNTSEQFDQPEGTRAPGTLCGPWLPAMTSGRCTPNRGLMWPRWSPRGSK